MGRTSAVRPWMLWAFIAVIAVAGLGIAGMSVFKRAEGMRAAITSPQAVLDARPGEKVKAVVRLENLAAPNVYSAVLLRSDDGTVYRRTSDRIRVGLSADTAVVMGGAADIKSGAVVQVNGGMDAGQTLQATQIVILTDYVRVVEGP